MQALLQKLLFESNIFHIEEDSLDLQLQSHPDATSIKAISDTLDYFGVDNLVANVPKDIWSQLPIVFLALIEENDLTELVLVKIKNKKITLFKSDNSKITKNESDFKALWTGTIIAIEKEETSVRPSLFSRYKANFFIGLFVLLIVVIQFMNYELIAGLYTLLALVGFYISFLILQEELGVNNATVTKFCNAISTTSNCNNVIKSEKNTFLNIVKLSDASILFFAAILLITNTIGFNHSLLLMVASASMAIVVFSIYHQAISLRKWCALCLGVATILTLQFLLLLATGQITLEISLMFVLKAISIVIGTIALWNYIRPLLSNTQKLKTTLTDFLKFKRSNGIFNFLRSQKALLSSDDIFLKNQIVFGNPNATLVIKAVTNPLCGFCVESFEVYDTILNDYKDDVQLQFVFNVANDSENIATKISLRIVDLYFNDGPSIAYAALKSWFEDRNFEKWQQQFGEGSMMKEKWMQTLSQHREWCVINKINYTPATLIHNNFFPEDYQISDLLLFIDDLIVDTKEYTTHHN